MRVQLRHRHYGTHSFVKDVEVPGTFQDYLIEDNADKSARKLNEAKLILALPPKFLPHKPESILLTVSSYKSGTAISSPTKFRPWAKYFDAYVLDIIEE